jgi:hypothetical protein
MREKMIMVLYSFLASSDRTVTVAVVRDLEKNDIPDRRTILPTIFSAIQANPFKIVFQIAWALLRSFSRRLPRAALNDEQRPGLEILSVVVVFMSNSRRFVVVFAFSYGDVSRSFT